MVIREKDQIKCPDCGTQITEARNKRWSQPGFIVPIYSYEYDVRCPNCKRDFLYCGEAILDKVI